MEILSTYSFILLIIIILVFMISFTNATKYKYLFIFMVTLSLSVLAMFFNPITAFSNGNYTDLYRFYQTLDSIKGLPFNNNSYIFQEYNNIPVMKVLLFLISRTGINNMLPFVISFMFYGLFGIFIVKICEKYNISNRVLGLSFLSFICVFNFKMVISNMRCPIGDSVFMLTLYYDLFSTKKNKFYWLGYLICCGIHPIFILFSSLRIILKLTNSFTEKIFYVCTLMYSIFVNYILDFLEKYTNIELFKYLSMKMNFYLDYMDIMSSELLIVIFGIIYILVLIYFMFISRKFINKSSSEREIYKISIAFMVLTIGSYWNFVFFQRCTWLLIFFIIYWYLFLKGNRKDSSQKSIYMYDIVMIGLVILSLIYYFFTYQYGILTF